MNYGDIKNVIMRALDLPTGMTGPVSDQVDDKIKEIANEIIGEYRPIELLRKAGPVTITNGDDEIPLNVGGFSVTDLVIPYGLTVGTYTGWADERDDKFIPYISYEAWIESNSYKLGNSRPDNAFTIDLDDNILLSSPPEGTESWDVYLLYYAPIGAYLSSNTPEIPEYFHSAITTGVILEFPQYFKTAERLAAFAQYRARYTRAMDKLFTLRSLKKRHMNTSGRSNRNTRNIFGRSLLSL